MFERMTEPVRAVVTAAGRPATYGGQLRELTSTLVTTAMWPFGFVDRGPEADAQTDAVETPVLLVHGFGANKSNWSFVRRYLGQAGFGRVDAWNYNPFGGDIPTLAAQCAERAEELKARHGVDRVHLVGHSMGGIIVRYAVQVLGLDGVGVAATVCSPHGGIRLARRGFARDDGPFASGRQLAPDSEVMRLFRSTARPLPTRFVAYYANLDLLVPARRAKIVEPELEARNILVKDHGHLSVMLSRRLAASVSEQLGAAEGLVGAGATVEAMPGPPGAGVGARPLAQAG